MTRLAAVTGGTGFVGGHVLRLLAAQGWRLRLLVRRDPRLDLGDEPVELVPGDLGDTAALERLVEGADILVHLAGAIRHVSREGFMRANRDGTLALGQAWQRRAPAARFVLMSSLAARAPHLSHYGASKRAAEDGLAALSGAGLRILRPTAIYGPGDRETLALFRAARLPVHPIPGARHARLTLVHVRDVARAVLAAATDAPAGRFEVTDDRPGGYRWAEVVGAACEAVGTRRRAVHLPAVIARGVGLAGDLAAAATGSARMTTSQKMREILHPDWSSRTGDQLPQTVWHPATGIREGFDESVRWYRAAGWLG